MNTFPNDNPRIYSIIKYSVLIIPAVIISFTSYSFDKPDEIWLLPQMKKLISGWHGFVGLFIICLPIIAVFIFDFWEKRSLINVEIKLGDAPTKHMKSILTALDNIVGEKMERFGNYATKLRSDFEFGSNTFDDITQPDLQIAVILSHFFASMRDLTGLNDLKMVAMDPQDCENNLYCFPKNARPTNDVIRSKRSFF